MTHLKEYPDLPEPIAHRYWSIGHTARWQLAGKHVPPDAEALFSFEQLRAYADAKVAMRARKPLTDAQIDEAIQQHVDPIATYLKLHNFARAIERAHGIGAPDEN